eukprot:TRINITY_DN1050_c0_g1_i2.p1 TRINITY_DN1050_c0_g1~~TRINITY_DN1050_c0_g1_i2.p1  ORF type:complete len:241 (-),score=24.20 TRINITY_DN1050_c0_g1_i2:335-1057(-)
MPYDSSGRDLEPSCEGMSGTKEHETPCFQRKRVVRSCPWTREEDHKLISCIQQMPRNRWKKISEMLQGNRTASQCCQRWHRLINPRMGGSGWTDQQDQTLVKLVSMYGTCSWSKISRNFPDKSDVQCRLRHIQIIRTSNPIFDPTESQRANDAIANRSLPVWSLVKFLNHPSLPAHYPVVGPIFKVAAGDLKQMIQGKTDPQPSFACGNPLLSPFQPNPHPVKQASFARDPRMEIASLLS